MEFVSIFYPNENFRGYFLFFFDTDLTILDRSAMKFCVTLLDIFSSNKNLLFMSLLYPTYVLVNRYLLQLLFRDIFHKSRAILGIF